MNKTLYILRGIPGSGKSSLAQLLVDEPRHVVEADDYFTDPQTGKYHFQGRLIGEAHKCCQERVAQLLDLGIERVVVSNTSLRPQDVRLYTKMAEDAGYTPFVIRCENDFGNIHGVPEEKMEMFRAYARCASR